MFAHLKLCVFTWNKHFFIVNQMKSWKCSQLWPAECFFLFTVMNFKKLFVRNLKKNMRGGGGGFLISLSCTDHWRLQREQGKVSFSHQMILFCYKSCSFVPWRELEVADVLWRFLFFFFLCLCLSSFWTALKSHVCHRNWRYLLLMQSEETELWVETLSDRCAWRSS